MPKNRNVANAGGKWIRQDKRLAIYLRDGMACVYCGREMERGDTLLTLDHVLPQDLGGDNGEGNLVTACKCCNSAKQAKPLREFLQHLTDNGVDAKLVAKRIRNHTRRSLRKWRKMAKAVLKARD